MHIDFKITTWERIEVPEGKEQEVKALIESGKITCANDLSEALGGVPSQHMIELDEQMTPEDNGGCSTIELFNEKGEDPTWQNGFALEQD